jgi:hypothetical protein
MSFCYDPLRNPLSNPSCSVADMKAIAAILIALFALPGCAGKFHRAQVAEQALTSLVGMSKKDLYFCAGVPARQEQVDGLEFLTYIAGGDRTATGIATATSPGTGVGVASSQRRYCEVTFLLANGTVQKVNYLGRTGGWATKGEQCAFVVENCLQK